VVRDNQGKGPRWRRRLICKKCRVRQAKKKPPPNLGRIASGEEETLLAGASDRVKEHKEKSLIKGVKKLGRVREINLKKEGRPNGPGPGNQKGNERGSCMKNHKGRRKKPPGKRTVKAGRGKLRLAHDCRRPGRRRSSFRATKTNRLKGEV